jgi:hypothetical protein
MKTVATYTGKVVKMAIPPDASTVVLTEDGTNKTVETMAMTEKLLEQKLNEGDSFKIIIYQSMDGKCIGELEKI